MARKPRLDVPGELYHVLSRGNNRQDVFLDQKDYQRFLNIVLRIKAKISFTIHAYCLMPNHFHLLMEAERVPISKIMQRILTTYTVHFNKVYKRNGHLFQGRYKSILCERDSYLLELVRYIHLNPVRAGLAQTPRAWKWSGHAEYFTEQSQGIVTAKNVLAYFSKDFATARRRYADFVREGLSMGHTQRYYPPEKLPYLGEDKFIEDMTIKHIELVERHFSKTDMRKSISLESIINGIAEAENVSTRSLLSKSRIKAVAQARRKIIERAIMQGHRPADIARYLQCSPCYITKIENNK